MNLKPLLNRFRENIFLISMLFVFITSAHAQKSISGKVISDGVPLIGANVLVKGTNTLTVTDFDGKFLLSVSNDADLLVVSYIGYVSKEVQITEGEMTINLVEDVTQLKEVIVNVGYGTQKKSVNTGAISKVSSKDLEKVPNSRIEQALQGRVSGVTIAQNSGSPGSSSTIRVRGVTTFGSGNNPLWVVDGIVVDQSGIGFINQSDIESIEVLKDAASAAIYGTRAATGVILVTTKKGKAGKISVNYTGFSGVSSPERTLKVLNATQYGAIMNEKAAAAGQTQPFPNLSLLGKGTDWQKEVFNNSASRSNHELSFSGGNDTSNFYISLGMQDQQGIVATDISNYTKKNFRINSNHKISKVFNIGQTLAYTNQKQIGIGSQNTEFGGVLSSAIMLDPTTPVVVTDPVIANGAPYNQTDPNQVGHYVIRDTNGNPYGISSMVGQEIVNPVAFMKTQRGNFGWSDDFVANLFIEANIISGLKFRTNFGGKKAFYGNEYFSPKNYLNASSNSNRNSLTRNEGKAFDWIISNTLTYTKQINNHSFTILLGQEVNELNVGTYTGISHSNLPTNNYQEASFNFNIPSADRTGFSTTNVPHRLTSLFTRVNYDFKEKYLFTGIFRKDGSSKFGPNEKYGYFPSVSIGWVVSKEDFWNTNSYVNSLKLKGGYGVTGNTGSLPDFRYLALVAGGSNYTFGNANGIITGYAPTTLDNPDLHWEETSQGNFGLDARLLNDFTLGAEYFVKKTSGILQQVSIPGYVGVNQNPWANVADMENRGLELELGYKKRFNELNISANAVFSTLKNEVTNIGRGVDFLTQDAAGFQSMGVVTRTQVGEAYNSFYGFQTAGIFQNVAEINTYTNSSGGLIQPNAVPGDFRWVDNNGDGQITDADKKFLGSPIPKYNFGFTFNAEYKNFDVMVFAQGAGGNKIFQGLRRLDVGNANYQTEVLDRWHGEGTSNSYPRITNNDTNGNFGKMSDFYLEDGNYVRLKLVQLGYSLPQRFINKIGASKIRLFVNAENLITLTKYSGYDPEIGGTTMGIDKGYYPQARSFIFGANLQF
jgi:TonB-linked SusC/RagA family outer membrane protein